MAEIEIPKSPPPPEKGTRDDSLGTLLKLVGGCFLSFCGCTMGPILLLFSLPLMMYGGVFFLLISILCIIVGLYSAHYTYQGIQKASG